MGWPFKREQTIKHNQITTTMNMNTIDEDVENENNSDVQFRGQLHALKTVNFVNINHGLRRVQ